MPHPKVVKLGNIFNEEFNRSVLNSMTAHIAVLDRQGRIIAVNDAWNRFALENDHRAPGAVGVGADYLDVCRRAAAGGDRSAGEASAGIEAVIDGTRKEFVLEYPCHSPGQERWFLMKVAPMRHIDGAVVAHEDITARRTAEQELHRSHALLESRVRSRTAELEGLTTALRAEIAEREAAEKRLLQTAAVFDNTNEAIVVKDARQRVITVNPAFTRITGYTLPEVVGQNVVPRLLARESAKFCERIAQTLANDGQWQGEAWSQRKNGERYPAWGSISTVKDQAGEVANYVAVFSDISAIKAAEARLADLAHRDQLTGLANRLLFTATLEQAIERARRHRGQFALLFLDLDRFKMVNDTLGHLAGDQLLRAVGDRIRQCVRSNDVVARFGGDEFTVLLEEISHSKDAANLANKLNRALSEEIHVEGFSLSASASIGISIYPDDAIHAADLLRTADSAMYSAKEQGRNTYQFYRAELTEEAFERLSIEHDLRRGLTDDELLVLYQPQFCPSSNRLFGMEALVRWRHPTLGWVLPERFIGIAEESGLIHQIDDWVLRTVLTQVRDWLAEGTPIPRVSINLSARELLHEHLGDRIRQALADTGVDPSKTPVELEITESVLHRSDRMLDTLRGLRNHGVSLAIDDFGTGYSSLGQLRRLPVDTVKIDRSFLQGFGENGDSRAIVSAILAMGHSLGLNVVAEGVETQAQLDYLREHGCEAVQGLLLSQPLTAEDMRALLRAAT